jgi:hydrocephalus-inducing protein
MSRNQHGEMLLSTESVSTKSKIAMKYVKPSSKRRALMATQEAASRYRPSALMLDVAGTRSSSDSLDGLCETPRIVELMDLAENSAAVRSSVPQSEPLFQPHPCRLKFEGYEPFSQSERVLYLRNNDHVNRRVKVLALDSLHFKVSGPRRPGILAELTQSKIAPGMEVCYVVTFKPQEVKHYSADLVVVTEREKFIVPVLAVGYRAALDLPDSITFPQAPVKASRVKLLVVRNVGTCTAVAALSCSNADDSSSSSYISANDNDSSSVFSVSPSELTLGVGESSTVEVTFAPQRAIQYSGELIAAYEGKKTLIVCIAFSNNAQL